MQQTSLLERRVRCGQRLQSLPVVLQQHLPLLVRRKLLRDHALLVHLLRRGRRKRRVRLQAVMTKLSDALLDNK